jgi:hypothetical protein
MVNGEIGGSRRKENKDHYTYMYSGFFTGCFNFLQVLGSNQATLDLSWFYGQSKAFDFSSYM